jgi:diguanylate cyclase (GGDEF)-like protein
METALTTSKVVHELHQSATTDPLTGLKNRRGFESEMAKMGSGKGALIYADLDRFKALNDSLGHPAGDAALVHFAGLIREHIRTSDTAARIGGEEFAIWLPDASAAVAMDIANRIRQSLVGPGMFLWQGSQWPLTASYGVSACPRNEQEPAKPAGPGRRRALQGEERWPQHGGDGGFLSLCLPGSCRDDNKRPTQRRQDAKNQLK